MIKKFFLAALLVCSVATMSAAMPTVYFQIFDNSGKVNDAWVETVRGAVLEGIHNTNRVNLIDAVSEASRYEEELRRLKENLATDDLESTEALMTKGASVLISGDVTALPISKTTLDSGSTSYDASVTFTLRVVNALDGTMISTKTFTLPKSLMGLSLTSLKSLSKTEDEAVQAIKGDITKAMKDFVADAFPVSGVVEEIDKYTKNNKEIDTFYVGIGSQDGIAKGNKLDVKVENKIGKKIAYKTIGEVEVIEVAGDDISLCKVKKGGADIKDAMDQGKTVIVITKTKK